ncbi:putative UDP-rhamnose:rhamnosyltransferase 1 [Juglans microcarpa x Juglans regia]|uniref:putative UDP-rhamnose:rhamnosyltransferase 1 n=1 Tax=Juglans microcarpa x Juglans regia TaxID=2249226 RepID=UPI001B7E410E|nr:putative UDP-rhamnose:rhamnosyltransferase 1 [Juglans microcarpa x Juglans regia]
MNSENTTKMDAMADDLPKKLHIAMFPWLAFGHIIPFLELSKHIARKGHHVSFISTPKNIERLPKIPLDLASFITFVKLPLSHVENLPENAEATMDVPHHIIPYLKIAYDSLQEPLSRFLETSTPDWIVYDFAPHWLPPIAVKLCISRAFFSVFSASCLGFLGPPAQSSVMEDAIYPKGMRMEPERLTVPPKWVPFPTKVAFPLFMAKQLVLGFYEENASGISDWFRYSKTVLGSEFMAVKACMEVEGEWLKLVGKLYNLPIIPVGLLPPSAEDQGGHDDNNDSTWGTIVEWLDKPEKGSVAYVAFGSETKPSQEDFKELALGLEQSGLPFFLVLRKQNSQENGEDLDDQIPEGFEERTRDRGVIWKGWAPQVKILGHDSVGGYFTHCGWSSVTEAFQFGRPLIMLPIFGDQVLNAKLLEEMQTGADVPRNEQDGSFSRESVAKTLRLVMKDVEGQIYRDKAKEMMTTFGDKQLQDRYVVKFVEFLENHGQACGDR